MTALEKQNSEGGSKMVLTYDIFERLPDGQPLWVKAVGTLEEARAHIVALGCSSGRSVRCEARIGSASPGRLAAKI